MRYAIFSDVHANLEAFERVLAAYENELIDKYLCIGDIVGYAANPRECIKIIRGKNIATVAGNHDWASTGKFDIDYFNPYAKAAVAWTRNKIEKSDIDYLNDLNLVYKEDDFTLVHGTLINPEYFDYMFEPENAKVSFGAMDVSLCFVGHTHVPVTFIKEGRKISYSKNNLIDIQLQKQYIINVGSVGQPRDRDSRACYSIYDSEEKVVQIKRVEYDIQATQTKIINSGLPLFLAERLALGQ